MAEPSELSDAEREFSRRKFLAVGGALAAAGAVGTWVDPLANLVDRAWAKGPLSAADAIRVRESQFPSVGQFRQLHKDADRVGAPGQTGLRATGTAEEAGYVDGLREQLERSGVQDVHFDPVPLQRWTTSEWSLDLISGPSAGPVRTASYVPYSGQTSPAGVTGPLAVVAPGSTPAPGSLAGKIAVFDVPLTIVPIAFFAGLAYPGRQYDPRALLDPNEPYKRPYLNGVIPTLEALQAAGAIGAVGVLDYPAEAANGSYFPYDGQIRGVPSLYVDRTVGARLRAQAQGGAQARLRLPAEVRSVTSRNLIGFIPGQSDELVAVHCHTDGTNAIEDNGPGAIIAISDYLARLPREALPSTFMVLLTTGHFHGGIGSDTFCAQHASDLVARTKAALTLEHLGTREWNEVQPGRMALTGRPEPAAIFAPGSEALVDASFDALVRADNDPTSVLRPLNPNSSGDPNAAAWPGEGQSLFAHGKISDANYISGPTYLLNWGITTVDKVDLGRVRAEAIAFTEELLRLGRTPRSELTTYTL
jgi:hypothetical protein